jgi:hypothetical protein
MSNSQTPGMYIILVLTLLTYITSSQATYTSISQVRTGNFLFTQGQIILYDDVYLSITAPTQYSATFSSAFGAGSLTSGVSVCGF